MHLAVDLVLVDFRLRVMEETSKVKEHLETRVGERGHFQSSRRAEL